jgi:hypothetical protein
VGRPGHRAGRLVLWTVCSGRPAARGRRDLCRLLWPEGSAPSVSSALLTKVLLSALHDGCSDRKSIKHMRTHLGWKLALGLPLDDPGCHPTTLTVFRARLVLHDMDRVLRRMSTPRPVRPWWRGKEHHQLAPTGAAAACPFAPAGAGHASTAPSPNPGRTKAGSGGLGSHKARYRGQRKMGLQLFLVGLLADLDRLSRLSSATPASASGLVTTTQAPAWASCEAGRGFPRAPSGKGA